MSRAFLITAAVALSAALPSLATASTLAVNSDASAPIHFTSVTTSPDPLTTDGNALPFRFDVFYDPATNLVTSTDISLGVPTGSSGFYLSFPTGSQVGSLSASFPTPISAGPTGAFSADVTNPDGSHLTFTGSDNASSPVSSLSITIEKKTFGVWVGIPAIDLLNTPAVTPSWAASGDYYARLQLFDAFHSTLFNTEIYFTNDSGSAPFHFVPAPAATPVPTPAAALAALPLLALTALHHLRNRRA